MQKLLNLVSPSSSPILSCSTSSNSPLDLTLYSWLVPLSVKFFRGPSLKMLSSSIYLNTYLLIDFPINQLTHDRLTDFPSVALALEAEELMGHLNIDVLITMVFHSYILLLYQTEYLKTFRLYLFLDVSDPLIDCRNRLYISNAFRYFWDRANNRFLDFVENAYLSLSCCLSWSLSGGKKLKRFVRLHSRLRRAFRWDFIKCSKYSIVHFILGQKDVNTKKNFIRGVQKFIVREQLNLL